jgi:Spy/CpxP family protein refolding chaperone
MGMWQIRLAIGLLVGAGWVISCSATGVAAEQPPAKSEGATETPKAGDAPKADEAVTAKIERQINSIEDKMKALQQEDSQISMAAVTAQGAVKGEDVEKVRKELEKPVVSKKEYQEYRAILQAAAGQGKALAEKYDRILSQLKTLDRERDKVSPSLQTKIDELTKRTSDKHSSTLEKVVSYYRRCADYKNAAQTQQAIYQMTPEAKRTREMKKELAGLYKQAGDLKSSVALYKSMFEAIPEKDRMKDRVLVEEVAGAYKDAGDLRTAAQLYKGLWDAIPEKDRGKPKNPELAKTIADFYDKAGDGRSAAVFYKAYWDASDKKDSGTGEKLGDLCDKFGDPRTALTVYQAAYDAMNDKDKGDKNKGARVNGKIQNLKIKLGIR